jgi:hypothetical protein
MHRPLLDSPPRGVAKVKTPHYWYWLEILKEATLVALEVRNGKPSIKTSRLVALSISRLPEKLRLSGDKERVLAHLKACALCRNSLTFSLTIRLRRKAKRKSQVAI